MKKIKTILSIFLSFSLILFLPVKTSAKVSEKKSPNNYPVVMVHGLFGWGNDELFGINYWGGKSSLREDLESKGYEVYTPTIGSVSSNWDRACELYAYLKGGTVDYGEAHSRKFGHERYGRTYEGAIKNLGVNPKKIHLIGHSMGGQTVRVLAQLLENGDLNEMSTTPKDNISPLFTGGKHYIDSIVTIATPHDGSQESHEQYGIEPLAHDFFAAISVFAGLGNSNNPCFDFKLDQWGLKKKPGESYESYYNRVVHSSIWGKTTDLSVYDLSPEGARDLNTWVNAQKDIYYLSIACVDTHESPITHHQIPNINMNPLMLKSSYFMGAYTNSKPGDVNINKSWWKNDGIVSFVSATSPKVGSKDKMVQFDGSLKKGLWNYMYTINNVDHIEVVGMNNNKTYLQNKYYELFKMLKQLPN